MIIAGSGGHSLEVWDSIKPLFDEDKLVFFSEFKNGNSKLVEKKLIHSKEDLIQQLETDNRFCLGVGNPELRKRFKYLLEELGGTFYSIKDKTSNVSSTSHGQFDSMAFSFVGPETVIGKGVLINTRANIHHNCFVGSFTEIGPGAILLGGVRVGEKCRIGAGAIILPGVKLGNDVIVGAGAVVTKDVPDLKIVVGIPAKFIKP